MEHKQYRRKYSKMKRLEEDFFVSYAVRGNVFNHELGIRYDMPDRYPLINSPVIEPSPLNVQYKYNIPYSLCGVL